MPIILFSYLFASKKQCPINKNNFFGLCVNLNREPDLAPELVKELGIKQLLIRVPLSEIKDIQKYLSFSRQFTDQKILINILQDRQNIDDPVLCKKNIQLIVFCF